MTVLARLAPRAIKAAGVPSISDDGTFAVAPSFAWLATMLGRTLAGVPIGEESALGLPTLYACVRVLAESVASLPLIVYRRLPKGGKERAADHPMYRVLHDQPNSEMTSFVWRETGMTHLGTWGNSYNEVLTDTFGRREIWPLPPSRMEVGWENGRKVFDYLQAGGKRKRLKDGTVLHIPGLSLSGLVGMSPIATQRETLGEASATRNFGASFYRNSARPGGVLQTPKTLSAGAIERLATQMEDLAGSGNAGKTVVLEEDMKFLEVGVPPEDAQYIETRKLQREEVAAVYRVPQHMVGILDHATFSNIEQESINFAVNTLRPWLVRIEQAINAFFFADEPDVFAEFLIDGLLRGDSKTRAEALMVQRQAGVLTKHEWQQIENRNPSGDDDIWVPIANHSAVAVDDKGFPIPEEQPVEAPPADLTLAEPQQPPRLTVIKSAAVRCEGRLATGEVCDKLLIEMATPPYRATCPRCKTVASKSADELAVSEIATEDELPELRAEVRSMAAYIDAQKSAPEPSRVQLEVLNPPPVVNIPAPVVNVPPVDNRPVIAALHRMEEALLAPRRKNLIRDADGRITGVEEVAS